MWQVNEMLCQGFSLRLQRCLRVRKVADAHLLTLPISAETSTRQTDGTTYSNFPQPPLAIRNKTGDSTLEFANLITYSVGKRFNQPESDCIGATGRLKPVHIMFCQQRVFRKISLSPTPLLRVTKNLCLYVLLAQRQRSKRQQTAKHRG